jgi:hypothetical protein
MEKLELKLFRFFLYFKDGNVMFATMHQINNHKLCWIIRISKLFSWLSREDLHNYLLHQEKLSCLGNFMGFLVNKFVSNFQLDTYYVY